MRFINVRQGNTTVVALENPDIGLTTGGISTCICVMAKGIVGGMPYLAMLHWEGFNASFDKHAPDATVKAQAIVDKLFKTLAESIAVEMADYEEDEDLAPYLSELYLIGGQRAEKDLSGTELEVETLARDATAACDRHFITSNKTKYTREHYLTRETHDVRIFFNASGVQTLFDASFDDDYDSDVSSPGSSPG